MVTFAVCSFLSLAQLFLVNYFIKPKTFYLCILHFFLIYPIIFNQLTPLTLQILNLSFDDAINFNLIQAYILNFLYYSLALILWKIFTSTDNHNFVSTFTDKSIFILALGAGIYNLIKVLSFLYFLDLDLDVILFPFNTFFYNVSKVIPFALLFYLNSTETKNNSLSIFVKISIFVYFISIIPTGHRSSLILPAILLIFYISKFSFYKKAFISIICIFSFAQVADLYKSFRIILNPNEAINSKEFVSSSFLEEVNYRFNVSNEVSSAIVEIINNERPVGLEPLRSSIYAIIPSSSLQSRKPWPGSIDGTEFGILPRIAHQYLYQSGQNMSEYIYPLHPIWEIGYMYYFLNIFLATFIILFFEKFSFYIGDKKLLVPVATMLPFSYSYTFPPIVLLFQQLIYVFIPGIAFVILIKILIKTFKPIFSRKYVWKTI